MSVGDEEIQRAIIVDVHHPGSPADHWQGRVSEAVSQRLVREPELSFVVVEGVELLVVVGDEEVKLAIPVEISGVDSHAALLGAVEPHGRHHLGRDVLEAPVLLVFKEEIVADIIGYVDVAPAIVVEVTDGYAHAPFGPGLRVQGYAGAPAGVGEGPVPVVSEKGIMNRGVLSGGAIARYVVVEAWLARAEVHLAVIGDVEIEVSITVVVEEGRAGAEPGVIHSALGGNLGEGKVRLRAVVAVEMVASKARDVDVQVSIGVIVANAAAYREPPRLQSFLRGDVLEGAIPPVAVEGVGRAGGQVLRRRQGATVEEVDVEVPVVVKVEEAYPGGEGLDDEVLAGASIRMPKGNSRGL